MFPRRSIITGDVILKTEKRLPATAGRAYDFFLI
jgi:hypothetical protein